MMILMLTDEMIKKIQDGDTVWVTVNENSASEHEVGLSHSDTTNRKWRPETPR